MISTLKQASILTALLIIIAAASYSAGVAIKSANASQSEARTNYGQPLPNIRAAVELLQREPLSFLITERVVTQVVTEANNGNALLGYGNGLLVGKVELLFGLDLSELDLSQATVENDTIHITVPQPKLLRYVPDLDSLRYIEKKSALLVIIDRARGKNLYQACLDRLEASAAEFAINNNLTPTRADLIDRLNNYAPVLTARVGANVVFD
jgi:hypothetical protein